MNIYLDIDGTLIHKDGTPAEGLHEFLEYVLANHICYWLTTHCRDGNPEYLYSYLRPKLPPDTLELTKSILPTTWDVMKTEGINFTQDFRWFDDSPMNFELLDLQKRGVLNRLVNVNLLDKKLQTYTETINKLD